MRLLIEDVPLGLGVAANVENVLGVLDKADATAGKEEVYVLEVLGAEFELIANGELGASEIDAAEELGGTTTVTTVVNGGQLSSCTICCSKSRSIAA